jgi:signal transduction histidine kinase
MNFEDFEQEFDFELGKIATVEIGRQKSLIMIVDDDHGLRESFALALRDKYEVVLCAGGQEGIDRLKQEVQAVVLDIRMSGIDGFETFTRMKQKNPYVPIIFYSAYQDLKDPYTIINEFRPFAYVKKEGDYVELVDTIESAVKYYQKLHENMLLIEKLKQMNLLLEKKVQQRTQELELLNEQLKEDIIARQQAEKGLIIKNEDLETANFELDCFVYTVSHDLQAPLRAIDAYIHFIQEDALEKMNRQGKEYVEQIQKSVKSMQNLITDLLSLSRITRIKNPYTHCAIQEVIIKVVSRLQHDLQRTKSQLILPKDLPIIKCDAIKMTEVFANLFHNAIKFSSKNEEHLPRVELGYLEEKEQHHFWVKDNGIGIDPKFQNKIFLLFRKLHPDTEFEGTGAGLSIVKRIIEEHKGKIWVESEQGKGATFHFTVSKNLRNRCEGEPVVEPSPVPPPSPP